MHSNGGRRQLLQDDDKVFSRHLTRDSSAANSSSRVFYYAGSSSSVPFRWESRPGTPKHPSSSSSSSIIPPLTPPPSYQVKASRQSTPDCTGPRSKPKAVAAILSKLSLSTPRRPLPLHISPASSVSSSASSSSSSTWSSSLHLSPLRLPGRRKTLSCTRFPRLEVDNDDDDDGDGNRRHPEEEDGEQEEYFGTPSPTSTLRFGTRRSSTNRGSRFRGCYPVKSVRNTFYSIVRHQGSV